MATAKKKAVKQTKVSKPAPKTTAKKKEIAKPTTKKAVAKKTIKPVAKKAAPKATVKKAVVSKSTVKKAVTKAVPKKKTAKPVVKKAAAKAAAKPVSPKTMSKAPARKVVAKPVTKKTTTQKTAPVKKAAATKISTQKQPVKKNVSAKKTTPVLQKPTVKPVVKKAATPVAKEKKAVKPAVVSRKEIKKAEITKKVKKENQPIKEVKVPKISTTSKKSYRPSYTPLEQRDETANQQPLVRYSEEELQEFKALITKKLADAKREVAYLQGIITRKDDMGGDVESRYMTMEDGTVSMEREQLSQMASRQIAYIDNLEKALIRIENKTYGICRVTGKLIDKARLRAVPHATLSIEAKLNRKNGGNVQ